jgi:DMSO/TMAO reductase YedYZ molybdopterin-dependent catalytic subunit
VASAGAAATTSIRRGSRRVSTTSAASRSCRRGPTPRTPLEEWTFSIQGAVDEARSWTWDEFTALPAEDVTVDIHCVTKWSKLDTRWEDVSVDTLLDGVETEADYVTAFADGDYTTNMGSRT